MIFLRFIFCLVLFLPFISPSSAAPKGFCIMLKYGGPTGKTVTKVIKENITQEECTNQLRGDTIVRFEPNPEGKKAILNPRAAGCQDGRCGSGAEGLKCPGTTSGFCICDRYKVCH